MEENTKYRIERVDWQFPETKATKLLIKAKKLWGLWSRAKDAKTWKWIGFVSKDDVKERFSDHHSDWLNSKEGEYIIEPEDEQEQVDNKDRDED